MIVMDSCGVPRVNPLQTRYLQPLEKLMEICILYRKYLWQRPAHVPETRLFFVTVCQIRYTFDCQETPTGWRSEDQDQSFCPALGTRWRNQCPCLYPDDAYDKFFRLSGKISPSGVRQVAFWWVFRHAKHEILRGNKPPSNPQNGGRPPVQIPPMNYISINAARKSFTF